MAKTQPANYSDHNDELVRLRHEDAALKQAREALEQAPIGLKGETHGDLVARYYVWYETTRKQALREAQAIEVKRCHSTAKLVKMIATLQAERDALQAQVQAAEQRAEELAFKSRT